jgi:hypothetical protein
VNVLLGLGLPWTIACCYYAARGETFHAPAGEVAFAVAVYMPAAIVCLLLLYYKRVYCGGELGGSGFLRNGVAGLLVVLWIVFLVICGLQVRWSSWTAHFTPL